MYHELKNSMFVPAHLALIP